MRIVPFLILSAWVLSGCGHKDCCPSPPGPTPTNFNISSWSVNNNASQNIYYNVNRTPAIRFRFGAAINRSTVPTNIILADISGSAVNSNYSYESSDSVIVLQPVSALSFLTKYKVTVSNS